VDDLDIVCEYGLTISSLDLAENYGARADAFTWKHVRCQSDGVIDDEGAAQKETPCAKSAHSATVVGDVVLIFGGVNAKYGDDSDELWAFDPAESSWTKLPNGRRARSAHSATCIDNRYLLVCGGSEGNEIIDCSTVDVYDTAKNLWFTASAHSNTSETPLPRAGHASVAVGNRWFIIGGGNHESAVCDAYTLDTRACVTESKVIWSKFIDNCALIGREGMSVCAIVSPAATYLVCHGGAAGVRERSIAHTVCCKLSSAYHAP